MDTESLTWSPVQQQALDAVHQWIEQSMAGRGEQVFRLFGYAGTGKTTLAIHLAQDAGEVLFGAFTGKAAMVLRKKGCMNATTLHRMIYLPHQKSHDRLHELQKTQGRQREVLASLEDDAKTRPTIEQDMERRQGEIDAELARLETPSFSLREENDTVDTADLITVDEVSQVGERMGGDLLSFGKPVLVLGDPFQLPPIGEGGFFTNQDPDIMLTEIHRQAADSPIIAMATDIRRGRTISPDRYQSDDARVLRSPGRVVRWPVAKLAKAAEFDQIIVGRNATRRTLNTRIRTEVCEKTSDLPQEGDKLVCLRNDRDSGLLNGGQWIASRDAEIIDQDIMHLWIQDPERGAESAFRVRAHRHYFDEREKPPFYQVREAQCFDYGYALTCHKAQGSQWGSVLVLDESGCFRDDGDRWLYTAVTRAAERVAVIR